MLATPCRIPADARRNLVRSVRALPRHRAGGRCRGARLGLRQPVPPCRAEALGHRSTAPPTRSAASSPPETARKCTLPAREGDRPRPGRRGRDARRWRAFRETAAPLPQRDRPSWRPAGGSRANHSPALTSAVVDGRDFLRARIEAAARPSCRRARRSSSPAGACRSNRRAGEDVRRQRLGHARQGARACRRPGPRPWRRHQGRRPARRLLGRAAQGAAADLLARPAPRPARRVQAQRADALAQSPLRGGLRRQRRPRAAGHPGEGEGHRRRRSSRSARHQSEACGTPELGDCRWEGCARRCGRPSAASG
jgi:hypothetical protein